MQKPAIVARGKRFALLYVPGGFPGRFVTTGGKTREIFGLESWKAFEGATNNVVNTRLEGDYGFDVWYVMRVTDLPAFENELGMEEL